MNQKVRLTLSKIWKKLRVKKRLKKRSSLPLDSRVLVDALLTRSPIMDQEEFTAKCQVQMQTLGMADIITTSENQQNLMGIINL